MPNFFYYSQAGQKQGPVTGPELQSRTTQGIIMPETIVENEQGKQTQAKNIKGLIFPKAAPSPLPPTPLPTPLPIIQSNAQSSPPPTLVASPVPSQLPVFASTAPPMTVDHPAGTLAHPPMPVPLATPLHNVQVSTANVHSMSNGDLYTHDDAFANSLNSDLYSTRAVPRVALVEGLIRGIPQIIAYSGGIVVLCAVIDNISSWLPESLRGSFPDVAVPMFLYFLLPSLIAVATAVVTILFRWLSAFNTTIQLTSRNLVVTNGTLSLQQTELEFHNIKSVGGEISLIEGLFGCGGIRLNMQDGTFFLVRFLPSDSVKHIRELILRYTTRTRTSSR